MEYQASEPRYVVAGDDAVFRSKEPCGAAKRLGGLPGAGDRQRALEEGRRSVAALVRRTVCDQGLLVLEVSTLNDDKEGNAIHVVSAADGRELWSRDYVPGQQHMKQARAMFIGDSAVDSRALEVRGARSADGRRQAAAGRPGFSHCFPPVATAQYLLAGEMDLTDLATGQSTPTGSPKRRAAATPAWCRPTA